MLYSVNCSNCRKLEHKTTLNGQSFLGEMHMSKKGRSLSVVVFTWFYYLFFYFLPTKRRPELTIDHECCRIYEDWSTRRQGCKFYFTHCFCCDMRYKLKTDNLPFLFHRILWLHASAFAWCQHFLRELRSTWETSVSWTENNKIKLETTKIIETQTIRNDLTQTQKHYETCLKAENLRR